MWATTLYPRRKESPTNHRSLLCSQTRGASTHPHLSHTSTLLSKSKTTQNAIRYMAAPLALLLCLAMLTLSLVVPAELTTEILLSVLFWAGDKTGFLTTSNAL